MLTEFLLLRVIVIDSVAAAAAATSSPTILYEPFGLPLGGIPPSLLTSCYYLHAFHFTKSLATIFQYQYLTKHQTNVVLVQFSTFVPATLSFLRFSVTSLEFLLDFILPAPLWPWGWLSP